MKISLDCIMLIDDNPADNYLHRKVIQQAQAADKVIEMSGGEVALTWLAENLETIDFPQIIFLDINMPGMSGWEFMQAYRELIQTSRQPVIVCMLTTSTSLDVAKRAQQEDQVQEFTVKPLTVETLETVLQRYFSDRVD